MTVVAYLNGTLATDTLSVNANGDGAFIEYGEKVTIIDDSFFMVFPGETPFKADKEVFKELAKAFLNSAITDDELQKKWFSKLSRTNDLWLECFIVSKTRQFIIKTTNDKITLKEFDNDSLVTFGYGAEHVQVAIRKGYSVENAVKFAISKASCVGGTSMVYKTENLV